MDNRKVPVTFDCVTVSSPFQEISNTTPNLGRIKVRVFTKYGNRNGSYITESVADQLIKSAIEGTTPVIGFFDPSTGTWASHTGPSLANGYGYVESFLGWEPFQDTDGVIRDYAVFSVVLFTKYFPEANKICGQNQSMELDCDSITGDWAVIDGEEYYVYNTAKMLGFCVIGEHEPCFSVSSFFSKNDGMAQYEQFASMLKELKEQVEAIENKEKEDRRAMEEFEIQNAEVVEAEVETEEVAAEVEEEVVETESATEFAAEETSEEVEVEAAVESEPVVVNYEDLYNNLKNDYDALANTYQALKTESDQKIAAFENKIEELNASIATYELQNQEREQRELAAKKNALVTKYENILNEEEIASYKENAQTMSYEELESQLAITFANKQINKVNKEKVMVPEQEESQFALIMKKYRKI